MFEVVQNKESGRRKNDWCHC